MVAKPFVSSIRSRHTGQVGNSTKEGVGGGAGFDVRAGPDRPEVSRAGAWEVLWVHVGVNGSFVVTGKLDGSLFASSVLNCIDLTNTTWQFSGCNKNRQLTLKKSTWAIASKSPPPCC